jgi:hypothetical protein
MARLKIDLRPILRALAARIQDENQDRLLQARGVRDEELAPKREGPSEPKTRKRVRILGVRVKLQDLSGKLGVRTGELLKDLVRRGNVKLGRLSFRIVPSSAELVLRWTVFNKGRGDKQPARPVSGITAQALQQASAEVARSAREQLVIALRAREKTS